MFFNEWCICILYTQLMCILPETFRCYFFRQYNITSSERLAVKHTYKYTHTYIHTHTQPRERMCVSTMYCWCRTKASRVFDIPININNTAIIAIPGPWCYGYRCIHQGIRSLYIPNTGRAGNMRGCRCCRYSSRRSNSNATWFL